MRVLGTPARRPDGSVLPLQAFIPEHGWGSVRPLQYGDAIRFYQNSHSRSPAMYAALFRVAVPGYEHVDASDIANMPAGMPRLFERAILDASGLLAGPEDEGDESGAESDESEPEDLPDHAVMAGEEADKASAHGKLDDFNESDLIHVLHQNSYTYEKIYGLLVPEVDTIIEGVNRSNERQQRERERTKDESSGGSGGGMKGNAGGSHADALF